MKKLIVASLLIVGCSTVGEHKAARNHVVKLIGHDYPVARVHYDAPCPSAMLEVFRQDVEKKDYAKTSCYLKDSNEIYYIPDAPYEILVHEELHAAKQSLTLSELDEFFAIWGTREVLGR